MRIWNKNKWKRLCEGRDPGQTPVRRALPVRLWVSGPGRAQPRVCTACGTEGRRDDPDLQRPPQQLQPPLEQAMLPPSPTGASFPGKDIPESAGPRTQKPARPSAPGSEGQTQRGARGQGAAPHLVGAQHRDEGTQLGPCLSAQLRAHGVPGVHQKHSHLCRAGRLRASLPPGLRPGSPPSSSPGPISAPPSPALPAQP